MPQREEGDFGVIIRGCGSHRGPGRRRFYSRFTELCLDTLLVMLQVEQSTAKSAHDISSNALALEQTTPELSSGIARFGVL